MAHITREDGDRFIIPSYRDVLSAKKPALLKKEVMLLSVSYGQYVALQRKNVDQYEAAFSAESGYLLGETVWHYFKRPADLIYCEALPNGTDAILVIVKEGSVYLDGSFPIDSIPDELIAFRTQQNNFEIYSYGNIPLSQTPEEGKFSLEASSVKSFTILPEPIFPTLPTLKVFQLRLVDIVLKSQGIGVIPTNRIIAGLIIIAVVWIGIMYISTNKKELPTVFINVVNPYQSYLHALTSPAPSAEVKFISAQIARLYTIPGWNPATITYSENLLRAGLQSSGTKLSILYDWTGMNGATLNIASDGVYVTMPVNIAYRPETQTISPLQQVIAELLDRLSTVTPGNNMKLGTVIDRGRFFETQLTIYCTDITLETLDLMADQLAGLPLVLVKMNLTINNGTVTGNLVLNALGN